MAMAGPMTNPSPGIRTNPSFGKDLKDRLDRKGLTYEELQIHQCGDSELLRVSQHLDNWQFVGYYLDLTRSVIKAIDNDNGTEEERRIELLYKWKQKNGDKATYYNLIAALYEAQRIDIVDEALICLKKSIAEIKSQQKEEQQKEEEWEKEERRQQELKLEYEMKENFLLRVTSQVSLKGLDVPDLQVNLRQEDIDPVAEQIGKDWYTFGKNMKVEESKLDYIKEVGKDKPGRKRKLLEHLISKKVRFEDIIYGLYNSFDEHDPSINGVLEYLFTIRIKQPEESYDGSQMPKSHERQNQKPALHKKGEQSSKPNEKQSLRSKLYEKQNPESNLQSQNLTLQCSSAATNAASAVLIPTPWQAKFGNRRKRPPTCTSSQLISQSDLTPGNYREHFYSALWFEEDEHIKKLSRKCDGIDYKLTLYGQNEVPPFLVQDRYQKFLYGYISGLSDDKIEYATQASDNVTILKPNGSDTRLCIAFKHQYNFNHLENCMYIVVPPNRNFLHVKGGSEISISAQFTVKYSYFDHLHDAVIKAPEYILPCLLPDVFSFGDLFLMFDPRQSHFDCLELDNKCQLKALKMIVSESSSTCKPAPPVILYGPFGTGKTRILARAAFEVMMNGINKRKRTRILISAHHEISITTFIFAYFGLIRRKTYLPFNIILISRRKNYGAYADMYMTPEEFSEKSAYISTMRHVIIIATYTMSLNLYQHLYSPEGFFTHLFLDEAAQVREPEAITPLALATKDAKIVLAGDNQQVGPNILVLGKEAKKFGLNIPLLERLLERYEKIGQVAASYVTKLSVNYRSHNSLIHLPNLFYKNLEINPDKSLQKCKGPTGYSFVSADSRLVEQYDDPDQQWVEACIVLEEVRSYLERMKHINPKFNPRHDVCIITSTRKQLNRIRTMAYKYKEYELVRKVSFNPSFIIQGHEFQAIFLSLFELVEEDDEMNASYIKSLFNPYVFNTAITRAKFFVVAIGSPEEVRKFEIDTLSHPDRGDNTTQCWHEYLHLCEKQGTMFNHRNISVLKRKNIDKEMQPQPSISDDAFPKKSTAGKKTEMKDEYKVEGNNHQSKKFNKEVPVTGPEETTRQLSLEERVQKLETAAENNGRIKALEEENAQLNERVKHLEQELEEKDKLIKAFSIVEAYRTAPKEQKKGATAESPQKHNKK